MYVFQARHHQGNLHPFRFTEGQSMYINWNNGLKLGSHLALDQNLILANYIKSWHET